MRIATAFALVAGLVVAPGPAADADVVHPVHGDRLALGPATVAIELTEREARYTVRYQLENRGDLPDEARVELAAPVGAAVIGLRYRPRDGAAWLEGRLLAVDDALARWDAYMEAPFVAPRGPALLELAAGVPMLRLLYVPARGRVAVEYRMVAPVCRAGGRWFAPVPELGDEVTVRVRGPRGAGRAVDAAEAAALAGARLDDACGRTDPVAAWSSPRLAVAAAPPVRGVDGRLVLVPAGTRRVVELTIDTASQLAPAPRDASVVFVVDASRSVGAAGVAAQLAVIRAYLARAPGARFELVVYRHHAHRLFGRWHDAAGAERVLAGAGEGAFALANGSHLDAGLAVAAELLARAPAPRRLIAFTDDRVRQGLDADTAAAALAALPPDAVAHVVVSGARGDASSLRRDVDHWTAPVAARWGGIAAHATVGTDGGLAGEAARRRAEVFEELVRPRRLEHVTILGGDGSVEELDEIPEGASVRRTLVRADDGFTVSGLVWGRPWQPTLAAGRAGDRARRRLAAFVFGDVELVSRLDERAQRELATLGHAVSEVTSLWADDPRWTPGGLPPEVGLVGHSGPCGISGITGGVGRLGTVSRSGGVGVHRERPALAALLARPVAACADRHHLASWSVDLAIELTGIEIVDVEVGAGAADAAFAACVEDAAWELELDDSYAPWTARFDVTVTGSRGSRPPP